MRKVSKSFASVLPDETETLFLRYVIDSDLFQQVGVNSLPWPEHVYLQAHFDLLGQRPLGEDGLDLGHHAGVDDAALRADGVNLLSDPGDDGEILREVRGEYPGDPAGVEILQLGDLCNRNVVNVVSSSSSSSSSSSPPSSKLSCRTSCTASSVASRVCSRHVSPLSLLRMTISRSRPRREAKWGTSMMTGPRNLAPAGPSSRTLLAMASPSISGGGWISLSFFRYLEITTRSHLGQFWPGLATNLHVTRIGIGAFLGGMMTRTPECLQPRMAPPRASTMKLTRNLETPAVREGR